MIKIKDMFNSIGEALFPQNYTCDICGIETFNENICADCLKTITFNYKINCPVCGRKTARPEICMECKAVVPKFKKAVSPLVYNGGTKTLIAKFKDGEGYLKEYFADIMAEKISNLPKTDYIIYVPMTKKAERKRGYNQARLLAESLSERIGVAVLNDTVVKVKDSAAQKRLNMKERVENLKGCFKVINKKELKGKNILLVDDVLTTGATAKELCSILLKAGVSAVYLATIASVEYKLNDKK